MVHWIGVSDVPHGGIQDGQFTPWCSMKYDGLALEILVNALRVRTPAKVLERVRGRIRDGLCIVESCDCPYKSHGLCVAHVNKYHYEFKRIWLAEGQKAAVEYQRRRAREGTYLFNQQQREMARIREAV